MIAHTQVLTATSSVNWNNNEFTSNVILDLKTAGFSMPSGRNAAVNKIRQTLLITQEIALVFIQEKLIVYRFIIL